MRSKQFVPHSQPASPASPKWFPIPEITWHHDQSSCDWSIRLFRVISAKTTRLVCVLRRTQQNQSPQPENSKITEKLSRKLIPVRIAAGKQMQAQLQSDLQSGLALNFQRGSRILYIHAVLLIRIVVNRRLLSAPKSNFQNKKN